MEDKKNLKTEDLLKTIFKLDDIIKALDVQGEDLILPEFNEHISKSSEKKNESNKKIILRAKLERSLEHKIFVGSRKPSRDTVIQLVFDFEADVELTQEMLKVAVKSLLYRSKRICV